MTVVVMLKTNEDMRSCRNDRETSPSALAMDDEEDG
jgi:hypothetical protein